MKLVKNKGQFILYVTNSFPVDMFHQTLKQNNILWFNVSDQGKNGIILEKNI